MPVVAGTRAVVVAVPRPRAPPRSPVLRGPEALLSVQGGSGRGLVLPKPIPGEGRGRRGRPSWPVHWPPPASLFGVEVHAREGKLGAKGAVGSGAWGEPWGQALDAGKARRRRPGVPPPCCSAWSCPVREERERGRWPTCKREE
jgi:hypothetical protein